jgi:hypothetical protein
VSEHPHVEGPDWSFHCTNYSIATVIHTDLDTEALPSSELPDMDLVSEGFRGNEVKVRHDPKTPEQQSHDTSLRSGHAKSTIPELGDRAALSSPPFRIE